MIKKIFITLLIIFASSEISFAKNNNEITTKNFDGLISPELHFDLPKKDAKEQCAEVEKIIRKCGNISKDGKINRCANVYLGSFYFYPLHDFSYGGLEPYLILDEFGNYVASNINYKMTFVLKYGDNKIFETKDSDVKKTTKRGIAVFYNQSCKLTKSTFINK